MSPGGTSLATESAKPELPIAPDDALRTGDAMADADKRGGEGRWLDVPRLPQFNGSATSWSWCGRAAAAMVYDYYCKASGKSSEYIGHKTGGARRWFDFHGVRFQPSELGKIALIIALAWYGERSVRVMHEWKRGIVFPGRATFHPPQVIRYQPGSNSRIKVGVTPAGNPDGAWHGRCLPSLTYLHTGRSFVDFSDLFSEPDDSPFCVPPFFSSSLSED